ncbi:MAG: sulfatase-like hydrolase/transferase, partial [Vicinamibacteria bacterium]
ARAVVALAVLSSCSDAERRLPLELERGSASGFDLLLVTLDTMRADRLGAYGYAEAKTPTLDRLAREGLRFETALSPVPLTLPAHATILTGLDPASHGVRHNGVFELDTSHRTLAEALRSRGYRTAAFVSSFVLDSRYGLGGGFETYDDRVDSGAGASFGALESERSASQVTDAAMEWIEKRPGDSPSFLWVHYYDAHFPYAGSYDEEIASVDSQMGRLLSSLEENARPILVVAVGDHGESLGEHREKTHGKLLYDATQKVPWILWAPSLLKGPLVVEDVVGLADVAPTILDLLGLEVPTEIDGESLLRTDGEDRLFYLETLAPYLDHGWAPLHGMRSRRAKYIDAPKAEYYDLENDPGERTNLFGSSAARSTELLKSALDRKLERSEAPADPVREVDPEELRRLQSLGYLAGAGPAPSGELPDPKDMMPVLQLLEEAEASRQAGRIEDAIEKVERARKGAPGDLQALQQLGILYAYRGRFGEAGELFRECLAVKKDPNVTILLANVLRESGRAAEGRKLVEEEIEASPDHGGLLVTLGDFFAAEGRAAEALTWYRRAKEVDPYRASKLADSRILELRSRR